MRAGAARESFAEISGGKEQLDRQKKCQDAQSDGVGAPAVSVPRAVDGRSSDGRGPQAERGPNGKLAFTGHGTIVYRTD